jgi:glycosyltransferase involved in cell wall biosynthesis
MKIDVVIPVRNGEAYIFRALESLCAQTRLPNKVIVVNDGSTDDTLRIINQGKFESINLEVISTKPQGLSAARNAGIRASEADFISLLDCDDYWSPNKLLNQENYLLDNPEARLLFSGCHINDEISGQTYFARENFDTRFSPQNVLTQKYSVIGSASSAIVHKKIFQRIGYFNEGMRYGEDYEFWVRCSQFFEFHEISNRDVYITRRQGSMQRNSQNKLDKFKNANMYLYVWSRCDFTTVGTLVALKRLLWADFSRALIKNPLSYFQIRKLLFCEYNEISKKLFPRKVSLILYTFDMLRLDVAKVIRKTLLKKFI